jgi:hypothetical protein
MTALGKTLPILAAKIVPRGLLLSIALLASAAIAAPNGTAGSIEDCFYKAQLQFAIDQALCGAIPAEGRGPCLSQAVQDYAMALQACGSSKSSSLRTEVTPGLKQNLDTAFTRRLR